MSMLTAVNDLARATPAPPRIYALAVLDAYNRRAVPLSPSETEEWFGVGGRYWQLMWRVAGLDGGERFIGTQDMGWAWGLPNPEAFWSEVNALAAASDAWQAERGAAPAPAPKVDVNALINRTTSWRERGFSIYPIWEGPPSTAKRHQAVLDEAGAQLRAWRQAGYAGTGAAPAPAKKRGAGVILAIGAALVALVASRRGKR